MMQIRARVLLVLIGSVLGSSLVVGSVSAAVIATSTFDQDTEGWIAVLVDVDGNVTPADVSFAAGAGNPGGALRHDSPPSPAVSYFAAPSFMVNALHSAVGGYVSWDISTLNHSEDEFFPAIDINVRAGNNRIRLSVTPPAPPVSTTSPTSYAHYRREFRTTAGWLFFDGENTTTATQAQIDSVLAGAEIFIIRAEYWSGELPDTTFLDNVIIGTAQPGPLASAVLPSSRAVQVDATATAFATVINAGPTTAIGCSISLSSGIPAQFSYQTTDPATNQVTGSPNTPVDIPGDSAQTFVVAFTPTAAFSTTDISLTFTCTNTGPAPVTPGVNTFLLSASTSPVPDIVALAATLNDDGIVNIPGVAGTGVFAVATVNLGVGGSITASANTGSAVLPVSILLCQTIPASGVCLADPTSTVTTQIDANDTPTFGVFVTGSGTVPFDAANNRVFVLFQDEGLVIRGATSVAVRTE